MTSDQPTVTTTLVTGEHAMSVFLADQLLADGHHVTSYDNADVAWGDLHGVFPDLVLLDARMEGRQAHVLLEHLRDPVHAHGRICSRAPVIVLGAQSELDRVRVLEGGADDAIACPFSYPELRSRIGAVLRRTQERAPAGPVRVGALELDHAAREVRLGGRRVPVSAREYEILRLLAVDPTRVLTKQELIRAVWGEGHRGSRTLDSHVCRLRGKLAAAGEQLIVNVWGIGYRLTSPAADA